MPRRLFGFLLPVSALAVLLAACSGSPQSERPQSGSFIDSAVQGLIYQTTMASSQTDAAGRFLFRTGNTVRFALLPDVLLGDAPVAAKAVMTPRDLFPGATASDPRIINLARVLQSLDADRNTANGIDLRQAQGELANLPVADRVTALALNVAPAELASANPKLMSYLQNANRPLVSEAVAARHLECSEQDVQNGQNPDGQCAADPVVISAQAATLSILEGQSEHVEQIELTLSAASDKPVTVSYATVADTATAGSDFTAASGTITFPAGSTSRSIPLSILGDTLAETNERFTVSLSAPLNATLATTVITVNILDDDTVATAAVLTLQAATLPESAGAASVKVLRQGQLDRALTIRVKALDGTAKAGGDFVRTEALLTIPAQVTEFLIPVSIVQDAAIETDESFTLAVSSEDAQVSVLGSPATITITDDDRDETLPELSLAALTASEKNAEHVLKVVAVLSEPAPRALELHYRTMPGSARSSGERADFVPVFDQVVMVPAGATSVDLPVSILGDRHEERDESFSVAARLAQRAEQSTVVTLSNDEELKLLQVGSAKMAAAPTNAQIAGEMESYAGGMRKQFFHLGGYGFGPFKLLPGYGPVPELRVGEAPLPVSNPPAGARCISPDISATNTTPETCTDVINVRVMVLLDPKTAERVAFVTIDAIGAGNLIQDAVKAAVNRASCAMDLCIPTRNVLFGQTHSHAGADLQGLWGGVPESWRQQALVGGAEQATTLALHNSRPARLSMARGDADEFNNYRRPKYRREALHQADPTVTLLMAKADDADTTSATLVGSLMQYAAHPTSIGNDDYKLPDGTVVRVPHPDYPLGVTEALEERFGTAGLYFNGPIADASPAGDTVGSNEYERVKSRGRALAAKAFGYLADHTVAIDPVLTVAHKEAVLPVSNPLFLSLGLLSQFNGYYQFSQVPKGDIPGFDQLPPDALAQFEAVQNQLPQPAPTARTLVSRISLGSDDALNADKNRLEIVTIPGETTNTFGQMIRRLANESPLTDAKPKRHTMLLGLTHNSFGYIIPEEEFSYVDPSGEAGLLLPGTAYEEFVSLGPLTAPLLRAQAYAPLFGVELPNPDFLPPALTDCQVALDFGSCLVGVGQDRLMQLLGLPEGLLASLKEGLSFLAEGCHSVAGPLESGCAVFDALVEGSESVPDLPATPGGGGVPAPGGAGSDEAALLPEVLRSTTLGCDFIDPANCLLPFPNDHFTQAADTETGRQVSLNPLAMPRNVAGKPIDPTDQNRADGFSPGQTILLRVPGLSLDKTAAAGVPVPRIGKPGFGQRMENSLHPDSAIVVYDVTDKQPHLVWAELDANLTGYTSCDIPAPLQTLAELGDQQALVDAVQSFRTGCNSAIKPVTDVQAGNDPTSDPGPLLIIRPGINFEHGHRYIVALRQLRDEQGEVIAATPGFRLCRDQADSPLRQLPAVAGRCAALSEVLRTLKDDAGIDPATLYSAWDFTVASERSVTGRLLGMRDQTLSAGTPGFAITAVEDQPYVASAGDCRDGGASDNCIARIIRGTMTVPNFIDRPVTATGQSDVDRQVGGKFWFGTPNPGPYDVPQPFPGQASVEVPFTCHIPRAAFSGSRSTASATGMTVRPSRVSLYGHGLFGSQSEIGQGQLRRFGGEHNYTFCATDWVGMSGIADVANAATLLLDLSGFPTLSDRVQQGILNFVVMGRLLKADDGFVADPAFRSADGRPLIDNREVFYDGNSQGGIDGGVVVAISPDIHRGVLGVPGMNYSTLLQRSVDFDGYARLMYASYQNTVDQQLALSFIQMLWDRSENNGYAQNLGDGVAGSISIGGRTQVIGKANHSLPGLDGKPLPAKQILLTPGFGDHQVSMISAEVMARTMGVEGADVFFKRPNQCAGDVTHCHATRADFLAQRHPDASPLPGLGLFDESGYADKERIAGSAMMLYDEGKTATPPADNRPPDADDFDPHEYPRNTIIARCQKARFLRADGRLIYDDLLATPEACPQMDGAGVSFTGDAPALPAPDTPTEEAAPVTSYGGGLVGALAQFMASLNQAIVALFNGDPEAALLAGQAAFEQFGGALADAFTGDDGPVAAIADAGGAAPDPQGMFDRFLSGIGRFLGLQDDPASAVMTMRPVRAAEAVVMTGAQLPGWSAPSAKGQGYPYPSGANITGQADEAEQLSPLNQIRDPLRVGEVRDAHNGEMIYPLAGQSIPFGAPVDEIAAYKWSGAGFEEIPVQVDEKFPFFLANAGSTFSIYSGTDPELTYAWDRENWDARDAAGNPCLASYPAGKPDPVASLDDDDEVVFMASDAGAMAPTGTLPAKATQVQMVRLQDVTDPQAERVVYLARQAGGSSFRSKPTYVRYQRNANADQWIDRSFFESDDPEILGSSNTSYGPNRKGTVCLDGSTPTASNDRFPRDGLVVETDIYRWEASGRWMIRDIRIKAPGVAKPDWAQIKNTRPDLLDRWKGRAFQQSPDSTISLVGFEDEQVNWEANSSLLGERCGPVRCMREVWGADSGTNVTKTETFYRDAVSYRYRIRVHPIPPDGLYTSWDYNRSAMLPSAAELANGVEPGRYFTALRPQGVPVDGINDDIGQIDSVTPVAGQCMTSDGPRPPDAKGRCPLFLDASDPTFNLPLAFDNWEQISGKGNSGALVYTFALKGATSLANPLVVPYYRDDACLDDGTGDDPVQRPWPGESSADSRVIAGYARNDAVERGGNGNGQVDCAEQQGVYGANGIHYFATHDSDNAFVPLTTTEVDGEQWQFMVPAAQPRNVGDAYANIIRVPLLAVAVPLTPPSLPDTPQARQQSMISGRRSGLLSLLQ